MPAFQPEPWRTDPRERLLTAIDRTWARAELGATPEQLADDYAHHLAEQVRRELPDGPAVAGIVLTRSAAEAADLIDPKAEAQR